MASNPNWTRDELILALDLYFEGGRTQLAKDDPQVLALSSLLNDLPIHLQADRTSSFRNPASVSMKLGNFLHFDPEYPGVGLPRGSKLDWDIWEEFAHRPAYLHRVADAMRRVHQSEEAQLPTVPQDGPAEEFPEGALLTRVHRRRERNRRLVQRKKERVLQDRGRLACEVCDFDFAETYGALGQGFAECHHLVPLADLAERTRTRWSALAIVCSNCHRMLHRGNPVLSLQELRAVFEEREER